MVSEVFDPAGILTFGSIEELPGVLSRATPEHDDSVRAAVEENFGLAADYRAVEHRVFDVFAPLID